MFTGLSIITIAFIAAVFVWLRILVSGNNDGASSLKRRLAAGLSIAFLSLCTTCLIAEWLFLLQGGKTDSIGYTTGASLWWDTYWKPVNSWGFRDDEHLPHELASNRLLVTLGDSIAAGHGIDHAEDRFGPRAAALLGDEWRSVVLAQCGWATQQQYRAFSQFLSRLSEVPFQESPQKLTVLWQYFVNDVDSTLKSEGVTGPVLIEPPARWLRPILSRSLLADFVYWKMVRVSATPEINERYLRYLRRGYDDAQLWTSYEAELEKLVSVLKERNAQTIVLLFPHFGLPAESSYMLGKVADFFRKHHVPVINVLDMYSGEPPEELVVSRYDFHPSVKVHHEVAGRVVEYIRGEDTLTP